jgi:spoIIIJ-associated protein
MEEQVLTPLTDDEKKLIEKTVDEFFKEVGVEGTTEITFSDEGVSILLETDDTGIVIGYHGEVLESLQLLLSLVIAKKLDRFQRVSIEVGDYKKNREAYLQNLALKAKDRALSEHSEQVISQLRSWERRVVHLFLQDDEDVETESVGEGKDRVLVIRPRSES